MTPALRVYLDEDVDALLVPLLAAHGLAAVTTLAAGNIGHSDDEQLSYAAGEGRILVTHNRRDFEALARAWWQVRDHAGIVLAHRRPGSYELLRRLLPVLQLYDQAGWRNSVVYA